MEKTITYAGVWTISNFQLLKYAGPFRFCEEFTNPSSYFSKNLWFHFLWKDHLNNPYPPRSERICKPPFWNIPSPEYIIVSSLCIFYEIGFVFLCQITWIICEWKVLLSFVFLCLHILLELQCSLVLSCRIMYYVNVSTLT